MKRLAWLSGALALTLGLMVAWFEYGAMVLPAWAAPPTTVCAPDSFNDCIFPNADGSINVVSTGGGGAVTIADGADVAEGATNASSCATDSGTCSVVALLKKIAANITTNTAALGGTGSTGSAPPATAVYAAANASGATGGLLKGLITCDLHAKYDASDNGSITMVTGVSGRKVYVCGYVLAVGGTATNLKLREGSDANCASNAADLTPAYQLTANQSIGVMAAFWTGLVVSTNAYYVCVNASAGNAHQAEVFYTIL